MTVTVSTRVVRGGKYEYIFIKPAVDPITGVRISGFETVPLTQLYDNIILTETVTKSSVNSPNWFQVLKTGTGMTANNYRYHKILMMRPYRDSSEIIISQGRTYRQVGYWVNDDDSSYPMRLAAAVPSARDIEGCRIRATQKCLEQMKDQKINLAQAIAERQQTADLIANILGDVAKLIKAFRRADIDGAVGVVRRYISRRSAKRLRKDADKVLDEAAQRWLQFQYGLRPLVADIEGAVKALSESVLPPRYKAVGRASTTRSFNEFPDVYTVRTLRSEYTCKIVVHYHAPGVVLPTLASLGLLNPAMLAWELLPWSFVADWALPIGDWLNTFDSAAGLVFEYGNETTYQKSDSQMSTRYDVSGPDYRYFGFVHGAGSSVELIRTKLDGFPLPRFPQFKNPLSLEHFANAAALIRQVSR